MMGPVRLQAFPLSLPSSLSADDKGTYAPSAADRGADLNKIMDMSRHADPRTLRT